VRCGGYQDWDSRRPVFLKTRDLRRDLRSTSSQLMRPRKARLKILHSCVETALFHQPASVGVLVPGRRILPPASDAANIQLWVLPSHATACSNALPSQATRRWLQFILKALRIPRFTRRQSQVVRVNDELFQGSGSGPPYFAPHLHSECNQFPNHLKITSGWREWRSAITRK